MKFAIASEHRDFFRKHQVIEFEGLLGEEQLKKLWLSVDAELKKRLKIEKKLTLPSPLDLYLSGRDLWRTSAAIKTIVLSKDLAAIASELIEHSPLRIGYDQLIAAPATPSEHIFKFQEPCTLETISCFQGVLGGLMLCLKGSATEDASTDTPTALFSNKAGSGVFFHANTVLDFQQLNQHLDQRYLLIVYTQAKTVYAPNQLDPNVHFLKQLGYNFGDRLSDRWHPLVYR